MGEMRGLCALHVLSYSDGSHSPQPLGEPYVGTAYQMWGLETWVKSKAHTSPLSEPQISLSLQGVVVVIFTLQGCSESLR